MLIYDGRGDKPFIKTDRSALVISCSSAGKSDHMTLRVNGRKDYSLFFIEKGKMTFDDKVVYKNQIWIYPPDVRQEYVIHKNDNAKYYYLHFTGNNIDELFLKLNIRLNTPLSSPEGVDSIIKDISFYVKTDDARSKLKCEYLTLKLLYCLSETLPSLDKNNLMRSVIEEMHHTYTLPYSASRFAKICALSESRFNHLFKAETGLAPQKYYNTLRMENAGILLKETKLTVTDIANRTGFADALYFGQAFKKFYGISPTEYRKR